MNTLIFVTEDDVQDGPDHVDSHRGPAFVIGPYLKHGVVISTHYSQVNVHRTIDKWDSMSEASTVLAGTQIALADPTVPGRSGHAIRRADLVRYAPGPTVRPTHDSVYWDTVTAGFDFSDADRVPRGAFNRVPWTGLMGDKPYPVTPNLTSRPT